MKKAIAYIMVVVVLLTIGGLGFAIYNKMLKAEEISERIRELRNFELNRLYKGNDSELSKTSYSTILTYFHTECRFCQSEIKDMQTHESLSQSAEIVLVSDESQSVIRSFVQNFDIDTTKFKIVLDKEQTIKQHFGVSSVPVTFVYDRDSLLIQSFKGETKASVLYDLIK
tara:strand:+ start:3138 stop:3647 length:510 start_codon:yes stop_codon:yes gene_type:complete